METEPNADEERALPISELRLTGRTAEVTGYAWLWVERLRATAPQAFEQLTREARLVARANEVGRKADEVYSTSHERAKAEGAGPMTAQVIAEAAVERWMETPEEAR